MKSTATHITRKRDLLMAWFFIVTFAIERMLTLEVTEAYYQENGQWSSDPVQDDRTRARHREIKRKARTG